MAKMDEEKQGNPPAADDLLGLFAPPPKRALHSSLFNPPTESDPLLSSPLDSDGFVHDFRGKISLGPKNRQSNIDENANDDENLAATVRSMNHQTTDFITVIDGKESFLRRQLNKKDSAPESANGGREFFLKAAAASPSQQKHDDHSSILFGKRNNAFRAAMSLRQSLGSFLAPFASPSTWMGGILFVLYHVVFCMANGGSITRPYSGDGSLLGDMARYTALGIIVSCPLQVFALSDRTKLGQIGIPAMYPSADLFLAPFLAEAAAIIDKTITDDWNAGKIIAYNTSTSGGFSLSQANDELLMTRLWFGTFAFVVSFGMFAAGSLLILASKFKLANLGTYLPYGVLCGFFSSVGILMWKLAITIDTPGWGKSEKPDWTIILMHHLPSLLVGIAMNRQGPKHPFVVTGLIIFTVVAFYGVMASLGVSLDQARADGWFYTKNELESSYFSVYSLIPSDDEIMEVATNADESIWNSRLMPPSPFGTWFALIGNYVHWNAVWKGAEHMIALAVLYLLRASIHAAALKKNVHNLIRRVPVEGSPSQEAPPAPPTRLANYQDEDIEFGSIEFQAPSVEFQTPKRSHRRLDSLASVSESVKAMAETVKTEVRIVNLSLADPKNLEGKCYVTPRPSISKKAQRSISVGSSTPAELTRRQRAISLGSAPTPGMRNFTRQEDSEEFIKPKGRPVPPIPPRTISRISEKSNESDELFLPTVPNLSKRTSARYVKAERISHGKKESSMELSTRSIGSNGSKNESAVKYSVDYMEISAPQSNLTLEDIFVQYGYGLFVTGACGGFGCCPTIATSNTMYAIGAGSPAPQYFSVIMLLVAFYSSGFELVRYIPKAAFSSLLVLSAMDNIVTWFIKPMSKMDNLLEWSVVPFIAMFSLLVGFLNAVILGIGVSTFLFVTDFFRVGVVKYDASGLQIRSRIERSLVQSVWLDTYGDSLRVLVLQNYLFFGNAFSVLRYVETMFEEIPCTASIPSDCSIPPLPAVLVLDLSLITGMDTSAVDIFMDIWRVCKSNDCKLYLCGMSTRLKKTFAKGGIRPDTKGAKKTRSLLYFSDLDHGLGRAEDVLIDRDMGDFTSQELFQLEKAKSGFHVALQYIDQLHSTKMADGLLDLEPYTSIVTLEKGQILYEQDGDDGLIQESDHGLFFIESGMVREDDDRSNRTNTRTGGSLLYKSFFAKGNDDTLRGKHARLDVVAQRAAMTKLAGEEGTSASRNLRITTAGPGW